MSNEPKVDLAAMKDQIESWEFEDPRETWWKWQHQYAQAADRIEALEAENERLREELAAAYVDQSGAVQHASDCATSNAPAMKPGPCDCAALSAKEPSQ